jgi:hypothetical protein
MDRHSDRRGIAAGVTRGRQWSRHFSFLTVIGGALIAACGSGKKDPTGGGEPGPPVNLVAVSSVTQKATVAANVATRPTVRVTDAEGVSVSGVEVIFAVTGGGGSITSAVRTTDAQGLATVGSWTMGPVAGANTLTASSDGLVGSPVTFTATASAATSNFNIKLEYLTGATVAQQAAFESAAARWQAVITGELTNVALNQPACGGLATVNETVDDLLILVVLDSIDGPSSVLGSAGPCLIRTSNGLTIVGQMTFDTADIATAIGNGSFTDIVLHEMGHVLGVGSMWHDARFNLIANYCTGTGVPTYTGAQALAAYKNSNGGGSATAVPVEDFANGGCDNGTYGSHWEESILKNELMTGFISGTTRPLSLTTVRSLVDLGYTVDDSQADPFDIATAGLRSGTGNTGPLIDLRGDVRQGPIYSVDDRPGGNGVIRRVR